VRTTDEPDVSVDTIGLAVATLVLPLATLLGGSSTSLPGRLFVAFLFFLFGAMGFMFSRIGIYLSRRGVVVWRGILPRRVIPWPDVAEFRLERARVDLGRTEAERVAVVTVAGDVIAYWFLSRRTRFEHHRLPVERAKAKLRTFPELIDQLNAIRVEAQHQ